MTAQQTTEINAFYYTIEDEDFVKVDKHLIEVMKVINKNKADAAAAEAKAE